MGMTPNDLIYAAWQFDPVLIGGILAVAAAYALATGPLRARIAPGEAWCKGAAAWFYGALVLFFVVEGSPLHDLAERYLLSAHMVQHLLLSYVVARMLIVGAPSWLWRAMLTQRRVLPVARVVLRPFVTFTVFAVFFAVWHVPVIYQAALMNAALHHVEHLVFLLTAVMLWWPILSPIEKIPRAPHLVRLAYLFTIPIAQLPVFAGITFSPDIVYPLYDIAPRAFGLTVMADQALAGATMKVFGLLFFGLPFARIFFEWYQRESGRRITQPDMRRGPTEVVT
jgi:putative membrane protein